MILKYINYISELERKHGMVATVFGLVIPIILLLAGVMLIMCGASMVEVAIQRLADYVNSLFYY